MNTGALHWLPPRQLITPDPYSPPTMNAAFFIDGMTITHEAFSHSSSGMPLSGAARSSCNIRPESLNRFVSSAEIVANADVASKLAHAHDRIVFTMLPPSSTQFVHRAADTVPPVATCRSSINSNTTWSERSACRPRVGTTTTDAVRPAARWSLKEIGRYVNLERHFN